MKLIAYPMTEPRPELRPAPGGRAWMDALPQAYAYRCLPLIIANSHGWEICCTDGFTALWNGGAGKEAIQVVPDADAKLPPMSHFGSGILTFHAGYLFRTPPGISMMVQGPVNRPKDGIHGLSGVIETDWSPYTFTMNWMFTRPGLPVRFEKGEPFCHFFPVERIGLEAVEPEIRDISEDPETLARHKLWSESRNTFNADLLKPGTEAREKKWQKDYFRGYNPDGTDGPDSHRSKLKLEGFKDMTAKAAPPPPSTSPEDGGDVGDK